MQTVQFEVWREHQAELLREAENERLARQLRASGRRKEARGFRGGLVSRLRNVFSSRRPMDEDTDIEVRWSTPEDEARIADLFELNGAPRRAADGGFVVAERDGEVQAAVRYRMEPKRLLLGLLVADPWTEERPLARALYAGARKLARETGAREIRTRSGRRPDYPSEAGYRRGKTRVTQQVA